MDGTTITLLILFAMACGFLGGIAIGKYHERMEWNKLIERGILPRPQKEKT